jgi:hypothetical protein
VGRSSFSLHYLRHEGVRPPCAAVFAARSPPLGSPDDSCRLAPRLPSYVARSRDRAMGRSPADGHGSPGRGTLRPGPRGRVRAPRRPSSTGLPGAPSDLSRDTRRLSGVASRPCSVGIELPPARIDVRTYDHDLALSSLVIALEREFGTNRLTTEREMRSADTPLGAAPVQHPGFAVPLAGGSRR